MPATAMVSPANSDDDEEEAAAAAGAAAAAALPLRALARRGGMVADVCALLERMRVSVGQTAKSASEERRLAEWATG